MVSRPHVQAHFMKCEESHYGVVTMLVSLSSLSVSARNLGGRSPSHVLLRLLLWAVLTPAV